MANIARVILALLLTWISASGVMLAHAAGEVARVSILRVDTSQPPWRDVYVSVADAQGLPVTGLQRDAFRIAEDGTAIPIERVAMATDSQVPIAIGLAIDVSGSMNDAGKLDRAKEAASQLVASLGPADSAAIISFGDSAQVVQGMTADKGALNSAIASLEAGGNTALYDAVVKTTLLSEALPQPFKVQLVVTDGMDTSSKAHLTDVLDDVRGSRSVAYAVGIGGDVDRSVLDQITQAGNGQALYTDDGSELASDFQAVLDRLRLTYVVRYRMPTGVAADQEHSVAANVEYEGQVAQTVGTFTPGAGTVAIDLSGVSAGDVITGNRQVRATVRSGSALRLDLLLDGTTVASSAGQPSSIVAELGPLSPGDHELVVRVADALGNVTIQHVPFTVAAAVIPTQVPTPPPTTLPNQPEQIRTEPPFWLLWVVVLLALFIAAALFLWWRSRRAQPAGGTTVTAVAEDDTTLDLAGPADGVALDQDQPVLRIDSQGQQRDITLGIDPLTIGRDADNTVVLRDPHVSRRHARITFDAGQYWIEDLKSQNGTLLNGQLAIDRRQLEPGDQFAIGGATLTFLAPALVSR